MLTVGTTTFSTAFEAFSQSTMRQVLRRSIAFSASRHRLADNGKFQFNADDGSDGIGLSENLSSHCALLERLNEKRPLLFYIFVGWAE